MKISRLILVLFFISLLSVAGYMAQDTITYPLWNGIEAGPHDVGFKVINYQDQNRTPSDTTNGVQFFPIQISMWYPAIDKWSAEKANPFKEYFYLTEQKNDFEELTAEQKQKAMDIFLGFTNFGLEKEFSKEEIDAIGDMATAAMKNSEPANERFPVIIAGHDGGVWKGTTLNEFLASYGYVVISTGLLSETSRMISNSPQQALKRRINTYEIIRGMLSDFEFIDDSRIGLLGINADGMTVLLYQMKNKEADALVSIDGWEGKNNGYEYVSSNPYYNTENFQIPYIEFQQHEKTNRESLQLNSSIFDALNSPSKQSYVLTDFGHAYLTGNLIAVPSLDEETIEKYQFMFGSILAFYDHYLRGEGSLYKKSDKPDSFFQRAEIILEK